MKKLKSVKEKVLNNFGLKILSIILALVLWLIARINS